jgi:two-component system, cell cycle sensor histidine kinase and response regulator CckA
MPSDKSNRQLPEELHALLLQEVQTLRGSLSRLEQLEQERQRAEEALRQEGQGLHERVELEAVGRLAGRIAHHFNNLLTVILGHADILLSDLKPDSPLCGSAVAIKGAGERAAALTQQLLTFSRQPPAVPVLLDLNSILSSLAPVLRRLLGPHIELTCALGSGLGEVRADPGQIGGLLLALAENARDAMPRGGRLGIQTSNLNFGQEQGQDQGGLPPGPWVLLAVSDTGQGMDEATRARLFEPFFTTKEVPERTGLGLATVHWIVRQSGGHIEVQSEPGKGATFKVYLPRGEGAAGKSQVGK